jgi:hypothetical protein
MHKLLPQSHLSCAAGPLRRPDLAFAVAAAGVLVLALPCCCCSLPGQVLQNRQVQSTDGNAVWVLVAGCVGDRTLIDTLVCQ